MNQQKPNAKLQEAKGTFKIIAYLYRHKTACLTELIDNVDANQKTVYRAIKILLSLDLISEEEKSTFPKRKIYSLTSKGHLLAEAPVYKWDMILSSFRYPRPRKKGSKNCIRGMCHKGLKSLVRPKVLDSF